MTPPKGYRIDQCGKTFDLWTVLSFYRYSGRESVWLCKCACGTERPIKQFHLVHGWYKSCGCLDIRKGWVIDGVGYIPLTQGQVTTVSSYRVEDLQKWNWWAVCMDGKYYAHRGNTREHVIHMARYILGMNTSDERRADHIDGNSLNNVDENLRPVDKYQSMWNRGVNSNNTTGATGVIPHKSWGKLTGKFRVRIMHMGEEIDLGVCDTVEEGRKIYDEAALRLHGEFVRIEK